MIEQKDPLDVINFWSTFFKTMRQQNQHFFSSYVEGIQYQMPISPTAIADIFLKALQALSKHPELLFDAQKAFLKDYSDMYKRILSPIENEIPTTMDKRFTHKAWHTDPYFIFIKEYYLANAQWLTEFVSHIEGIDRETKNKLQFYMNQFIEAVCPRNFPFFNPEVLEELVKTDGLSLKKGFDSFMDDVSTGHWMKMTDPSAFKLGETLATTKGDVVFRNEIMELIHYSPLTEKQFSVPLLIVPPWINKFYIFDLSPNNSYVKWMLEQGYDVFMISWVNPGPSLASKNFEDYLLEGAYKACEVVSDMTKSPTLNAMGYCIGGNLLAALGAYLAKSPAFFTLQSMTLMATIIDFSKAGDLKIFLDDENLDYVEHNLAQNGFLDPEKLKSIFSMLRPKDLVWSFFVKNYLLGQIPPAFDFLYWNSDATRVPEALHRDVLRKCFKENLFLTPGGLTINNLPIDIQNITTPTLFVSTIEDHIAPWKSSYPAVHQFKGPLQFLLAGSGHVAGIMNPPSRNKYAYYTNSDFPYHPEEWLDAAVRHEGSWWPSWHDWLKSMSGKKVKPKENSYSSLGPAPGVYVKEM